jgi:cyanophycinase-like exopeptidase
MELSEARGRLVAVGGAEDKEGECVILKEFVRLAKGERARVVVMTVASDLPEEDGEGLELHEVRLHVLPEGALQSAREEAARARGRSPERLARPDAKGLKG